MTLLINHEILNDLADSIRAKTNKAELIKGKNFSTEISAIPNYKTQLSQLANGTLTTLDSISCQSVVDNLCNSNKSLIFVNLPNATTIGQSAFAKCTALSSVKLPKVTQLKYYAFEDCSSLKVVDFSSAVTIGVEVFSGTALNTIILRSETVSPGGYYTFSGTPYANGEGYIYVPRALLEAYRTTATWSQHADKFRALEDYTVDGTITGELDESKVNPSVPM